MVNNWSHVDHVRTSELSDTFSYGSLRIYGNVYKHAYISEYIYVENGQW